MTARKSTPNLRRASSIGRVEDFYPSPFFDIASTYIPKSVKEVFEWCLYYQLTNPLIASVTSKLASYAITPIQVKSKNPGLVKVIESILEALKLVTHLVETNLDRYTFGNAFTTVHFPIKKVLICRACGFEHDISKAKYTWRDFGFQIRCKKCEAEGKAKVKELLIKSFKKISLIRWNPRNMELTPLGVAGEHCEYKLKLSRRLKNQILRGKKQVVETIPQAFIDAAKRNKKITISPSKVFHARRPSVSKDEEDSCWGTPLILPVLKDAFFLQVLRKAQEAVAMEHIVPMRVLFPAVRAEGDNVYGNVALTEWQSEVVKQVQQWKKDINHMPVMPVPIGYQQVGGQGRGMLLHQEIRIYSEQIISGMGVPVGFFYGEAQYTGASINLKALENEFQRNREDMTGLVKFILSEVCLFLGIPIPEFSFKPFRMADDLQRASFDFQLNQAGKISDRTLLNSRDHNYDQEAGRISEEKKRLADILTADAKAQAESQGQAMLIQTKYQMKAQELQQQMAPQQPMEGQEGAPQEGAPQEGMPQEGMPQEQMPQEQAPQEGMPQVMQDTGMTSENQPNAEGMPRYVDLFAQAKSIADELDQLPTMDRMRSLTIIKRDNPQMYALVSDYLNRSQVGSMIRPLPTSNRQGTMPQVVQNY